mmetsp:Transcript_103910/g.155593  ORF Transcript_103910/g.155593 Transcript_103910/m.155593 type:complete len:377 (+) Transcript_103910:2-1132(+)
MAVLLCTSVVFHSAVNVYIPSAGEIATPFQRQREPALLNSDRSGTEAIGTLKGGAVNQPLAEAIPARECGLSHVLTKFDPSTLAIRCDNFGELEEGGKHNVTGRGVNRKAVRGTWKGCAMAVKQMRGESSLESDAAMATEAAVHFLLRHATHIAPLRGFCAGKLVFDFMPGTLHNARFPPPRALELAREAALALAELHESPGGPFVHRDLTSSQFLLDQDGRVFLQDFNHLQYVGLAHPVFGSPSRCAADLAVCSGGGVRRCPEEMLKMLQEGEVRWSKIDLSPPTQALGTIRLDEKMDVFHFGFLLWKIFTGKKMHHDREWPGVWRMVLTRTWPQSEKWEGDPRLRDIIFDCWAFEPTSRPSAAQVAQRLQLLTI